EPLLLQLATKRHELAARLRDGLIGGQRLELHVSVTEFDEKRGRIHGHAGSDWKHFDATLRLRGDDANVLGYQRARRPHLAKQLSLPHRVDPQCGTLDARRRWLEAADDDRHEDDRQDPGAPDDVLLLFRLRCAFDVHEEIGAGCLVIGVWYELLKEGLCRP